MRMSPNTSASKSPLRNCVRSSRDGQSSSQRNTTKRGNGKPRRSALGPAAALRPILNLDGSQSSASHVAAPRRWGEGRPHALLHLARHPIVAHNSAAIAQATRLSLHHEHPERVAGLRHQGTPCLLRWYWRARARMGRVELPQPGEGLFQRSPYPSKRNGLLLGELIVENVDGRAIKAKLAGHSPCIAPHRSHAQRSAQSSAISARDMGVRPLAFAGKGAGAARRTQPALVAGVAPEAHRVPCSMRPHTLHRAVMLWPKPRSVLCWSTQWRPDRPSGDIRRKKSANEFHAQFYNNRSR